MSNGKVVPSSSFRRLSFFRRNDCFGAWLVCSLFRSSLIERNNTNNESPGSINVGAFVAEDHNLAY
jgi:hypothetical protein